MLTKLKDYFAAPNPSTLLVLVLPGDPDGRLTVIKTAKKVGWILSFDPLDTAAAGRWLGGRAQEGQIALTPEAATALVNSLGADRQALAQALEKLDLYAAGAPIDRAMVDAVVSPVFDEDVWALADLLGRGKLADALVSVQRLLDDQRSGHELVPGVAYRFRALARVVGAVAAGVPSRQLAKAAGVPPWDLQRSLPLARNWNAVGINAALSALSRADDRLKGGWGATERATMEALCLEVCGCFAR
jgi:DNA polymerase-3 subunit delta